MSESAKQEHFSVGAIAAAWWRYTCGSDAPDSSTRARLRRCRNNVEAATEPVALLLARRLGAFAPGAHPNDAERAIGLARVLASVRTEASETPLRALGWRNFPGDRAEADAGAERPRLGESRFRRLLTVPGGEEQVVAFRRLVALMDETANVSALANDFWYWSDRTKQRWAFDYYNARAAVPASTSTPDTDE
jgi:CRISPR system Cascade subunit CasB